MLEDMRGRYLVSTHLDNTIRVRSTGNGKTVYIIEVFPGEDWVIYKPGIFPVVASKKAYRLLKVRKRSTLLFKDKLLKDKKSYTKQLNFGD